MNAARHEALTIVHAGLADVLDWLGETPVEPWEPRHAAEWETVEIHRLSPFEGTTIIRRDAYQVPN